MPGQTRYRPDLDDDHGEMAGLGEHYFCGENVEGEPNWLVFGCRNPAGNKTGLCQVALRPQKNSVGASWAWDGNREAPTITPSINCEKVCGWHGWLRAGRFTP